MIHLYEDKSNPVGRDEKMLVSQRDFKAIDERDALSSFLRAVSDSSPQTKCFQIFIKSRFYS